MKNLPASKYFFRQRQGNRLYEEVIHAMEEAAEHDGIRQKEISETLGVSKSQVSRWLSGPSNWGVDTVSDLLFAIGAELEFHVVRFSDRPRGNDFHPAGEPYNPLKPRLAKTETDSPAVTLPPEALAKISRSWTARSSRD